MQALAPRASVDGAVGVLATASQRAGLRPRLGARLYRYCSAASACPSATFRRSPVRRLCAPPSLDSKPRRCCACAGRAAARRCPRRRPPRRPRPERSTRTGRRAATCSTATWYRRADPRDRGVKRAASSARGRCAAGAPRRCRTPPTPATCRRAATSGGVQWYRKDFEAPGGRGDRLGAALRVGQLPRDRVAERPPAGQPHRRLPAVRAAAAAGCAARGTNRLVVRVDSRRDEPAIPPLGVRNGRPVRRRLVELRRHPARGLPAPGRHARPRRTCTCARAWSCPTCAAQDLRARGGREPAGHPASTPGSTGTVGGQRDRVHAARRSRAAASTCSAAARRSRTRGSGARRTRTSTRWSWRSSTAAAWCSATRSAPGIRSIEVRRPRPDAAERPHLALRGASMHEEDPTRGAALRPGEIRANFDLLRELGATMTRSHYPLHPLALELADRYGIVVWSEVPVYQMRDALFRSAAVRRRALDMVRDMVNRDRSHPSVIVWSLGNENTSKPGRRLHALRARGGPARAAARPDAARRASRSPAIRRSASRSSTRASTRSGVNDYFGWYPGPQSSIADRAALAPYLDRLHDDYPQPGAVRDRVRRRGQPRRAADREGHVRVPGATSSTTTWTSSRRSRS